MKVLVTILAVLVSTMAVIPAYAVIVEIQAEKTSYKKGDQIIFTGRTDAAHANKIVAVKISDPSGNFVILRETFSDSAGNFKTNPIDTSAENTAAKFTVKGVYNASAFYSQESQKVWKFTLFDYSADGSPVSPSAADLMKQSQTSSTPPPSTPPSTTSPPVTQPPTSTSPPTTPPPQSQEPTCGTGTVLKDGVCVAESEPEPEPEPEPEQEAEPSGPKKTHIPGFPDPTKDPQSYIDRYNNEPKYKEWFDRNFPDETIYEIVGLAEPGAASSCGPGTRLENGACVLDESGGLFGGGCLIATAAYGTELSPQVQQLRELRDGTISKTGSGAAFMNAFNAAYYTFSPTVSDWERENTLFRDTVRVTLAPMLSTLSILNYADIDSEYEMVGYGLGIMLLNIGMYFVAPALVIIKIRDIARSKT